MSTNAEFQRDADLWIAIHGEEQVAEQQYEAARSALVSIRNRKQVAHVALQSFVGTNIPERAAIVNGDVLLISYGEDPRILPIKEPKE